jgi:hypothetical protein
MSEYVVLIVGDDQRWWKDVDEAEVARTMAEHERFGEALAKGGHKVTGGAELHSSADARTVRPGGEVTDGPFTETAEQVGGFYLVETDDLDGLLECCRILAALGDGIEVRRTVDRSGGGT